MAIAVTHYPKSLESVAAKLIANGFNQRARDVFTLELEPGVVGWLGLNRATQHRASGVVEVNPVVGVRFEEVERIVAECRGDKFHAYLPPTVSRPIGYVMPAKKYQAWVFSPDCEETVAADMVGAIVRYGVAFMRCYSDIAELRRGLEEGQGLEHQLTYRRPAAALVAGAVNDARVLLEQAELALGARTDAAATDFRNFASAFRGRIPVA